MTPGDLARLRQIAGLRLDLRLADLRQASAAKAETEARITDLEANFRAALSAEWADPRGVALYETWTGAQQRSLNLALARQAAELAHRRDAAALAFGQSEALRRIAEREAEARQTAQAWRRGEST